MTSGSDRTGNIAEPNFPAAPGDPEDARGSGRPLPDAARRALAEAEARRKAAGPAPQENTPEVGGRGGADPARYGDWEIDGRAIDF